MLLSKDSYSYVCQAMWRHPITAKQIRVLQEEWGVRDPEPSEGDTAGVAVANGWFQVIMVCFRWAFSVDLSIGLMLTKFVIADCKVRWISKEPSTGVMQSVNN